ncbi:DNA polymerase I [Prochlorococcus sp. MIT 1341]|uniref:DNA polymerase I n=1 Tax=Prochlorococcus sp. MIT 1341 TaxID=3096221 RepID=UPI002A747B06|nr:DNA polymerase I [Prochlorococcus sp. MIT 1341]
MSATKRRKLLLVDGHSLAFRSFYAFAKGGEGGLSTKEGKPTSVTFGFLKSLLENCKSISPEAVTIAFDTAEPTFRHKADSNYKANRDVAPDIFFEDLNQLKLILNDKLKLPLCVAPGFEADDVLGTLANKAVLAGWEVFILSGDRDLFQLVDDQKGISVLYMGGGRYSSSSDPLLIKESGVVEKLGVAPSKVVELKALTGDSSDNIPGVKGVGPKTAINLLKENGDLDTIYNVLDGLIKEGKPTAKIGSIKGALISKLINDKENAYLSKYLAKILIDVPLEYDDIIPLKSVDKQALSVSLEELELSSLVRQVPGFCAAFSEGGYLHNSKITKNEDNNLSKPIDQSLVSEDNSLPTTSIPIIKPIIIKEINQLKRIAKNLIQFRSIEKIVSIDTETTDLNPFQAELIGIGLCWGEGAGDLAYIPLGHKADLQLDSSEDNQQLKLEDVLKLLNPWFTSEENPKVLQNAKYDRLVLLRHGIDLKGVVLDTLIADYVLNPTSKHSLEFMSKKYFDYKPTSFNDLVKKGSTFADLSIENASLYCGMDVYLTRKLSFLLLREMELRGPKFLKLYNEIEGPLEIVLSFMEATGITIDIPYLRKLSTEFLDSLKLIEKQVCELAGGEFNLSSPKQLAELLFEQLKLDRKKSRRTKTGWSTDARVLEKLQNDHDVIPLLIQHRTINKLLTTYVDALPELVESETGRVHTDFNQAVTATGRLSSSNPNLQNIPIRTEFSRRIREAFLPQDGWKLLSADYSQIELRILAHLSGEEVLLEAYQNGDDVHSLTARILLEKELISDEDRRLGKTINFGVIYGMGTQRLARSTGLSNIDAKNFLDKFHKRYKKVFSYLEYQERLALTRGYVETIMGRRRPFSFDRNGLGRLLGKDPYEIDLISARRAGMEAQQLRAAANAPIQGSSADIIKVAMIDLHEVLLRSSLPARMLLQVHDELVLEVHSSVLNEVQELVVQTMEKAVKLSVPLLVETGIGRNWMETKK